LTTLEFARWYIAQYQFLPVPVPYMQKGPVLKDWPNLRLTVDTVPHYFNNSPQNIALLMGSPKNGPDGPRLADVDVDCAEARWAWIEYALDTGLHWGRKSNPNSHHLFFTEPAAESFKGLDPVMEKDNPKEACMIELRCLTKDGKIGMPVVCPPSQHPDNEPYEFVGRAGHPNTVSGPLLLARVKCACAAAMLGRHMKEGLRHEIFISLAGAFARAGWDLEEAQRFLRAVYRVIWRESADLRQANADANSTYQHYDDGKDTTGLPKLKGLIDERVFQRLIEWLGLDYEDYPRQQPPPRKGPRTLPESEPVDGLRGRDIVTPDWLIENLIKIPSITLLVSPPKIGKTVLAVQFAMSIANGLHLFDFYQNRFKPGEAPGLIVEWDDQQAEASIKAFTEKSRASRNPQPLDFIARPKESFTIADAEFKPWLIAQIHKRGAKICILDSLTALRGFGADDRTKNVVKLEASEVTMLGEIAIETGCAIIVIHHDSKAAAGLDIFSRAAGTYALQACTEAQIVLGRFPGLISDPARLLSIRGRHMGGLQAVLRFREQTLDFDLVYEGEAARYYPELRQLLHALRAQSFDAKRAMGETGWGRSKAYEVLGQLTDASILLKPKDSPSWEWNPIWEKTLQGI